MSLINSGAEGIDKVILVSTNIVKGIRGNLFSGKTVICPPLWQLKFKVGANGSEVVSLPQVYYNINNYSSDLTFFFSDLTTDQLFVSNLVVSITIILRKIG